MKKKWVITIIHKTPSKTLRRATLTNRNKSDSVKNTYQILPQTCLYSAFHCKKKNKKTEKLRLFYPTIFRILYDKTEKYYIFRQSWSNEVSHFLFYNFAKLRKFEESLLELEVQCHKSL